MLLDLIKISFGLDEMDELRFGNFNAKAIPLKLKVAIHKNLKRSVL